MDVRGVYCSPTCRKAAYRRRLRQQMVSRLCPLCKKLRVVVASELRRDDGGSSARADCRTADTAEVLDEEPRRLVRAARDDGTSAWSVTWALGVDRSTVYRQYLSPSPGEAEREPGLGANGVAERRVKGRRKRA